MAKSIYRILLLLFVVSLIAYHRGETEVLNHPPTKPRTSRQPIPKSDPGAAYYMIGLASWYSHGSPGINKRTANNERFDENSLTCAIWGRSFNSKVRVTNLENGRSVVLRVNDRGPHRRYFRKGRVIDLTKAAFEELSDKKKGLIRVKVEFL